MSSRIDSLALEKIGIVLATYNPNPLFLQKQIDSIKNQDWQNWVCHVVDDGSQPESQEVIQQVIVGDDRFMGHFHDHNLGYFLNFERGLQYCAKDASITAIAFADQDDIWKPEKLRILLTTLREQAAVLVHSDLEIIDDQDQIVHSSCWEFEGRHPEQLTTEFLLLKNTVTGCTLLFCASLLPTLLPFPKELAALGHHDAWVALVASHLGKIAHLRNSLVQYRQHGSNTIGAVRGAGQIQQELLVWIQQKKFRIVGKSYLAHQSLSQVFFQRFAPLFHNSFDESQRDFGVRILWLGFRSWRSGYGAGGVAMRLFALKSLIDISRILKRQEPGY